MVIGRSHGVIAATVFVITTAIGTAQAPISIGLVREDGHLIPIATLTPQLFEPPKFPATTTVNGEPLPSQVQGTGLPDRFQNVQWRLYGRGKDGRPVMPPARDWPPMTAAAKKLRAVEIKTEIKTIEPLMAQSHCVDQPVWRTTLTLPPAPENIAPVRKIGLAISGGSVDFPEDVSGQPDVESRRVARRIVQLTHAKERERLATEPAEYLPPARSAAERAKVAVRIPVLRRYVTSGVSTYYFEALKAWGPAVDLGLVTGWIVATPSRLVDHYVQYKFNDDGAKENDRAIVWGVVRYRGRALWVLEWHGYEWEYYTIHEWPSGVERLNVGGGGC